MTNEIPDNWTKNGHSLGPSTTCKDTHSGPSLLLSSHYRKCFFHVEEIFVILRIEITDAKIEFAHFMHTCWQLLVPYIAQIRSQNVLDGFSSAFVEIYCRRKTRIYGTKLTLSQQQCPKNLPLSDWYPLVDSNSEEEWYRQRQFPQTRPFTKMLEQH